MKISSALLMSGSFLCLSLPLAKAADEPLLPPLPQGYDVMTLSRGPSKITPGLEPDKNMNETATILTVVPASGGNAGTPSCRTHRRRIVWRRWRPSLPRLRETREAAEHELVAALRPSAS